MFNNGPIRDADPALIYEAGDERLSFRVKVNKEG